MKMLKESLSTYVAQARDAEVWPEKYRDVLVHFERVFSSHEMRCRKPEPAAYRAVVEYLGVLPVEIVFLDDRAENIEGAEAAGMRGILVESSPQMQAQLKQEGILS